MAECDGRSTGHCCHLGRHGVCPFVTHDGTRWVCRLRRYLGSWSAVHRSRTYGRIVRPMLDTHADHGPLPDCGDWPTPGLRCNTCGVTG